MKIQSPAGLAFQTVISIPYKLWFIIILAPIKHFSPLMDRMHWSIAASWLWDDTKRRNHEEHPRYMYQHIRTAVSGHCLGCYSMSVLKHRQPTTSLIGTDCRWPGIWPISWSIDLGQWLYCHGEGQHMITHQEKVVMQAFTSRMIVIQRLPSTGKTETVAWIVDAFARLHKKSLLTSGPNAAIDNVGKIRGHSV